MRRPTLASPLPPSYEEGAKKVCGFAASRFYCAGGAIYQNAPLAAQPYSPDPFFGKTTPAGVFRRPTAPKGRLLGRRWGAAAAAGYSSSLGVTGAFDNRIAAPPRPRRGKITCALPFAPQRRGQPRSGRGGDAPPGVAEGSISRYYTTINLNFKARWDILRGRQLRRFFYV